MPRHSFDLRALASGFEPGVEIDEPFSCFLGSGTEERVRLLKPENRRTVRRSRRRARKRLRGREDRRSDVAYATPHFCLTSPGARSRHHYGERTVGTLDGDRYDALHALESRFEGGCRGKTGKHCYKSATPCTRMQQQGSGV